MSKQSEFIAAIKHAAQEVQRQVGIFASVTIAQACLETGYSAHTPQDKDTGAESYNLFGIKARSGEAYVLSQTWEIYNSLPSSYIKYEKQSTGKYKVWIYAKFRKFKNFDECLLERATFFTRSSYWKKALAAKTAEECIHAIQHTGIPNGSGGEIAYATDPDYEAKILSIIKSNDLKQYDLIVVSATERYTKEEYAMLQELQKQVTALQAQVKAQDATIDLLAKYAVPVAKQKIADSFAKEGVPAFIKAAGISDGSRPQDAVSREELWTILKRFDTYLTKKG